MVIPRPNIFKTKSPPGAVSARGTVAHVSTMLCAAVSQKQPRRSHQELKLSLAMQSVRTKTAKVRVVCLPAEICLPSLCKDTFKKDSLNAGR